MEAARKVTMACKTLGAVVLTLVFILLPTGVFGATPTPTTTTPLVSPAASCGGDCDGSGEVTVNELLIMVNIALGGADVVACPAGDTDQDGTIIITEILAAVVNALSGCPVS